jgi:O-antigen/teichoic acid export membrane protein
MEPAATDQRRPGGARRGTGLLAAGSVVSGVLAYVFFALVTRALGAEPAAPVAVLWAWWSFAAAAFTFPVQHWISRTAATAAGEAAVRRGLPRVAALVTAVSAAAGVVAWLASDRLFGPDGTWFPLLVVAVGVCSGALGLARGILSGRHRFGAVGVGLVLENGLRCVVAAALMGAGNEHPASYGLALLAGYAAIGLRPSALVPRTSGSGEHGGPLAFVSGASAGQLLAQVTLTGGPVLLAAVGGAPVEVTALFAALALFRAPYTLAIGLVAPLTGRLTRLVEDGRHDALRWLREALAAATLLTALVGGLLAAWLGDTVLELVFGEGVRLGAALTAVVAIGSVFALANLILALGLLARGRPGLSARVWLAAAPLGLLAMVALPGDDVTRTCWAFLVVEAAAWLGFLLVEWRLDRSGQRQ